MFGAGFLVSLEQKTVEEVESNGEGQTGPHLISSLLQREPFNGGVFSAVSLASLSLRLFKVQTLQRSQLIVDFVP